VCKKNKCCNYAENIRRLRTKFSCPGDQALGVCAPLTYDILPFISWYYVSVTSDICTSQSIIILSNTLEINRRHRSYTDALQVSKSQYMYSKPFHSNSCIIFLLHIKQLLVFTGNCISSKHIHILGTREVFQ
jgi:hypothetical protein